MLTTLWNHPVRFRVTPWSSLLRELDDMFDSVQNASRPSGERNDTTFSPACDVEEAEGHYLVTFDIPGVQKDDLSIELTGTQLVVSGERKAVGQSARRAGRFQHAFTVPEGVSAEGIAAECRDGVLTLTIQKPAVARTTKIKIGDGKSKPSFFKNLVGEQKSKDAEVRQIREEEEPAAMAN